MYVSLLFEETALYDQRVISSKTRIKTVDGVGREGEFVCHQRVISSKTRIKFERMEDEWNSPDPELWQLEFRMTRI